MFLSHCLFRLQMRATIIAAISNLSTAYNLVNVNLTNAARQVALLLFGHFRRLWRTNFATPPGARPSPSEWCG